MSKYKADLIVDVTGLTCPMPLIKTRRAIKKSQIMDVIKFVGTEEEEVSRKEILIALKGMKQPILDVEVASDGSWLIYVEKHNRT
ncbi:MAG: sulfurtransferase TusA family protein [Candidatus Heimdallarchaeota archaeon]|nr:sulfurtransferase TusA family protein [Candidatus Heimdallarchaeota archaeon]